MRIDNGLIEMLSEEEAIKALQEKTHIPVDIRDATELQAVNMQVSLKDHRSKLGKKLTKARSLALNCGSKRKSKRRK